MFKRQDQDYSKQPVGPLGIVCLDSCKDLGKQVDEYLVKWRRERAESDNGKHPEHPIYHSYCKPRL